MQSWKIKGLIISYAQYKYTVHRYGNSRNTSCTWPMFDKLCSDDKNNKLACVQLVLHGWQLWYCFMQRLHLFIPHPCKTSDTLLLITISTPSDQIRVVIRVVLPTVCVCTLRRGRPSAPTSAWSLFLRFEPYAALLKHALHQTQHD